MAGFVWPTMGGLIIVGLLWSTIGCSSAQQSGTPQDKGVAPEAVTVQNPPASPQATPDIDHRSRTSVKPPMDESGRGLVRIPSAPKATSSPDPDQVQANKERPIPLPDVAEVASAVITRANAENSVSPVPNQEQSSAAPFERTSASGQVASADPLNKTAEEPQPARRNPLRDSDAAARPQPSALRLREENGITTASETQGLPSPQSSPTLDENASSGHGSVIGPSQQQASIKGKAKKGKHSGEPFDPVAVNGKYFENWPKPKVALVMTGRQDGYLEPCGCAGLDRMKGGLMRRHTFFEELRSQRRWEIVGLDVGGLIKGFGRQAELKFQTTVTAMQKMGYDAIGFGEGELRLPTGELVSVAAGVDGKPSPFISANVGLFGFASGLTGTKRILEVGGQKLGITAVFSSQYQKQIHNAEIEFAPPESALRKVLSELKSQRCDLLVLLAYAPLEEARDLATKFPEFDVVVTGGVGDPPDKPTKIGDKTLLIEVGEKGMGAVVLGLYDEEPRFRYQRVLLDSRYESSPEIKRLFAAYQDQLKELGLEGLGVRVAAYPQREVLGAFVGSARCEPCHEESYRIWKRSGHAKAYATLVEADPPRNFDPECISCHVIGWHPTKYFPYQGGFLSMEKTPHLIDVGCEACHGAGGNHCDAEMKNDPQLQEKLRKAMVVTKAESEKRFCATCHDLDNSPDFDFATYWPDIEHYEKE